jgi:hypothetical protein
MDYRIHLPPLAERDDSHRGDDDDDDDNDCENNFVVVDVAVNAVARW